MNTTELITPPAASGRAAPRSDAGDNASTSPSKPPTFSAMLAEIVPLVGAVAGYGPPVIFLAGPWLLVGLMLAGPFAFLVVLAVFMVVAATVLAALTAAVLAIVDALYLVVRQLRRHRARHAFGNDHAGRLVGVETPRVAA